MREIKSVRVVVIHAHLLEGGMGIGSMYHFQMNGCYHGSHLALVLSIITS